MTCYPGVFTLNLRDEVKRAVREDRPRVVKSLVHDGRFWREYKALVPNAYLIGRQYYQHEWERALVVDGTDPQNMLWAVHYATADCPYDALLGPNEYVAEPDVQLYWRRVLAVEHLFAALAREDGKGYFALSMPVGHLPPAWVVDELAADPSVTGLSLHLYSCNQPLQQAPYYQRYADFIRACPLPVLIGEIGRDCLAQRGWQQQSPPMSGKAYEVELYRATDLPAWGYTVFAYGCTDDWRDRGFEHLDCPELRSMLRDYDYSGFRKPGRKGDTVPDYTYPEGFSNYAKAHPEVGKPAGQARYDADGNLRQLTENGELVGLKAFGWKVVFLGPVPKASLPII